MSVNRVLKLVNIAIAILLVVAAGALYWYVYRPLPQTSGSLPAPLSGDARIARDSLGVPHIAAASIDDALFLQGYATAQDRLWQMDLLRRAASGELSEVFGAAAIEHDRESARMGMRRITEEHERGMTPSDRTIFAAYARGVNHFIETHRHKLPVEFTLLGYDPRPWRIEHSIAISLHMFRTLTASYRDELLKRGMLIKGDRAKVETLFPVRGGGEIHPGSNAWVLAGSRTISGKPLVANDPHLEWAHPSTWYFAHLQAPGLNVAGATLPGIPAVMIGHNERIAWGVTVLHFDVQDLYIEKLDPRTGRYAFQGRVEQARSDRETIAIKGQAHEEIQTWVTRHGPVLVSEGGASMAMRWTAAERGGFEFPFLDLAKAGDWKQFNAALKRLPGPGLNFVYGDVDGNIGYRVAGKLPIRRTYNGDVPVDGSSGEFEWDGYIPFEDLPAAFNPASGLLAIANQNPFPDPYPYRVHGNFDSPFRIRHIAARLNEQPKWDVRGQLSIQMDIYSAFSRSLAKHAVTAWNRRKPPNRELAEPIRLLGEWDGQMEAGKAAPLLATLLYQHVRRGVVERASPGMGLAYESRMGSAVIDKLLRDRPAGWFDDYDEFLIARLTDAVEEGRRLQGRDPAKWIYGRYLELRLTHPVLGRLPYVGGYLNLGPAEMSGSTTTIKQTSLRLGPSMRIVASAADWDSSLQVLNIGQSGQPLSSHFKDQWDAYLEGRAFPMRFRSIDGKSILTFRPGMAPGK